MGENVLQGQVKQFQKGRDRSLAGLAIPTLFDRPDIVTTRYTAAPVNGSEVQVGQKLVGHVSADGSRIHLAEGHRVVATIEGDGASSLIEALREPRSPGFTSMEVVDVSPISGFLTTAITSTRGANE